MSETEQDVLSPSTEESEERGEQTVTVEDTGPGRKALTIEIPESRIAQTLEKSYSKFKSDAQVPGFRKGRAPMRLLQRRFGSDIRDDVRGRLISAAYTQAVEDEKLEVIGEPDVKDVENIKLPESGSLTIKAEVEVSPKVELPPLEEIAVTKKKMTVSDSDVEQEVSNLRERFGAMNEVDGPVQADDYLQVHVNIYLAEGEGEAAEIAHHHEAYIKVNGESLEYKGHVVGIVVDDLGKRLIGKTKGDELTIEMTGPTGHEDERIRAKPIRIKIRIEGIRRVELAPLDGLPALVGMESIEDLRKNIQQQLERRSDAQQRQDMRKQVSDYLAQKVDLTLPEGLTRRQTERSLMRQRLELSYQGVPEQEIEQRVAEARSTSEADAVRQLKLFFILTQAAKQLEVAVGESEINSHIYTMAMQQRRRPEKLRQEMHQRGEIQHLYLQSREQKTLDAIVGKAKVTEEA